jgi:hypothetical protein
MNKPETNTAELNSLDTFLIDTMGSQRMIGYQALLAGSIVTGLYAGIAAEKIISVPGEIQHDTFIGTATQPAREPNNYNHALDILSGVGPGIAVTLTLGLLSTKRALRALRKVEPGKADR